jgi:stage V sporulation protein B
MAIANVTFQAIVAVTFVAFPLISQSTYTNDVPTTQKYISQTMRFSLMITALLAVLFSSNARGLLDLIYPDEYLAGAPALRVVPFGMLMFGMISVLTTIISSSGRPGVSLLMGLSTLLADVALNYLLIPRYGLLGAAAATTSAMFVGMSVGAAYVSKKFKVLVPAKSLTRITVAALIVYFLSLSSSGATWIVLGSMAVQTVIYLIVLVVLRELGSEELRAAKAIFSVAND